MPVYIQNKTQCIHGIYVTSTTRDREVCYVQKGGLATNIQIITNWLVQ